MNRNEYRELIKKYSKYVTMKVLVNDLGISSSNYYAFMNGDDKRLSEDNLSIILKSLHNRPIGGDIEELPKYMYNHAETLTESQLSNFVDTFDGESFAIRDIKKVISSLLKNEPALQISTEIEDAKTLSTFYFSNEYKKFFDENLVNSYLDESGESGYSIYENDYYMSFTKWENGENTKEVFIWK